MGFYHVFDGFGQTLFVDSGVYLQQDGVVVGCLSLTCHALGIDTHLGLRQGDGVVKS